MREIFGAVLGLLIWCSSFLISCEAQIVETSDWADRDYERVVIRNAN